jgi:hypothetical protein
LTSRRARRTRPSATTLGHRGLVTHRPQCGIQARKLVTQLLGLRPVDPLAFGELLAHLRGALADVLRNTIKRRRHRSPLSSGPRLGNDATAGRGHHRHRCLDIAKPLAHTMRRGES